MIGYKIKIYVEIKNVVSWHDTTLLLDANMPDKQKAYPDITARIRPKKIYNLI